MVSIRGILCARKCVPSLRSGWGEVKNKACTELNPAMSLENDPFYLRSVQGGGTPLYAPTNGTFVCTDISQWYSRTRRRRDGS